MKTSRPHLVLLSLLLPLTASLFAACAHAPKRNILKINIAHKLTHIRAGGRARLTAYQEYRDESTDVDAVSAAPSMSGLHHEEVAARWSVFETELASISEDGTLSALKPGRVTIKSNWESYEDSATVEVVRNLPVESLPQMSSSGLKCAPSYVELGLDDERAVNFKLSFDVDGCRDFELKAAAPARPLPWEFEAGGARLELKSARGPIVNGSARFPGGGEVSFTVWANGAGAFPVQLSGKSILLIGDSMAGGIGPYLQKRVEEAGGRFISGEEQSSTIIWWQGSGKLRELLGQHRPDIVFIALGSNELFVSQPETRAPLIKAMVEELGGRPAFWIGPPSWKPDGGLVRVIDENFQPGHFYDSNNLKVARAPDGKHPTAQGYQYWTELIWNWYAHAL
jgi:lysophospholipase L1-like esterase